MGYENCGRKPLTPQSKRGKEMIHQALPRSIRRITEIMASKDERIALQAAIWIAEQGEGKATQRTEISGDLTVTANPFAGIPLEELRRLLALAEARRLMLGPVIEGEVVEESSQPSAVGSQPKKRGWPLGKPRRAHRTAGEGNP